MLTSTDILAQSNSPAATQIKFKFKEIADSKDGFTNFDNVLLNDDGLVAFSTSNDASQITGIFTSSGGKIRTIADLQNGQFTNLGDFDLNDNGLVAFAAGNENSSRITGLFTSDGKTTKTVVDLQTLSNSFSDLLSQFPPDRLIATYSFGDNLALSDAGNVLFDAEANFRVYGVNQPVDRLFLSQTDGTLAQVAEATGLIGGGTSRTNTFSNLQINDRGQTLAQIDTKIEFGQSASNTTIVFDGKILAVAGSGPQQPFTERVFSPVLNDAGTAFFARSGTAYGNRTEVDANNIYRFDSGATEPVRVSDQRLDVTSFTVNDRGSILFSGSTANQSGLFLLDQGTITQISDRIAANALINNSGVIVFQPGQLGSESTGIFARVGSVTEQVIAPGESLGGSIVQQVQLRGLNDAGQIAFSVDFTDGTEGIYRADTKIKIRHGKGNALENGADVVLGASRLLPQDLISIAGRNALDLATQPQLVSSQSIF
ncbi:MAG: hypothetical protein KME13_12765 [Myxacorys californica WJT36-NPBG1]|jgi:hypothetical protein|nr:hypothetical protein [Myxacorys californica WJT36-NPBG1]